MSRGALDEQTFQERASRFVADHPGLINVTWADEEFVIRWTAPHEPNKQVIGLSLVLPEPERASHEARDTVEAAALALVAKLFPHARTAEGAIASNVKRSDASDKALILTYPSTQRAFPPAIEATRGNLQAAACYTWSYG